MQRIDVPITDLTPQVINPNSMGERQFNLLVDNIQKVGFTDPILVRPLGEGKYRIVGGEHRWKAAKVLGMETVPVTVIERDDFDDDAERFQIVRHNVIKGSMSAQKFLDLYQSLSTKYEEEVAAELFGFSETETFQKLIKATASSLPKEMQEKFKESVKEIKTIEGLALLLNRLFTEYGDTLPYGYMFLDFGGKESVWVRLKETDKKNFKSLAAVCMANKRTLDGVFSEFLHLIAEADSVLLATLIAKSPVVVFPPNAAMPLQDQAVGG